MGYYNYSDIVENVAYIGDEPKEYNDHLENDYVNFISNGWTFEVDNTIEIGMKNRLNGKLVHKDGMKVYIVNTSPYANGGDYDNIVCSPDRKAVELFLKDFGIGADIVDKDAVSETR